MSPGLEMVDQGKQKGNWRKDSLTKQRKKMGLGRKKFELVNKEKNNTTKDQNASTAEKCNQRKMKYVARAEMLGRGKNLT